MQNPLAAVAVVGPWKMDEIDINSEKAIQVILDEAYKFSEEKYGNRKYYWVTLGTQTGFGRYVLNFCRKNDIKLISIDTIPMHFQNKYTFGSQEDLEAIFKCRHAALMELIDYFFIKCAFRMTNINDLIIRVKKSDKPYCIFNEENVAIEYRGDTLENAKQQSKGQRL